jgi:hypothetical protein
MAGRVRGFAFDVGQLTDVVPDGIDVDGVEPAEALGLGVGREKQGVRFGPEVGLPT